MVFHASTWLYTMFMLKHYTTDLKVEIFEKISIKSAKITRFSVKIKSFSMKMRIFEVKINSVREKQKFSRKCELFLVNYLPEHEHPNRGTRCSLPFINHKYVYRFINSSKTNCLL